MFSPAGFTLWQEERARGAAQDEGLENRELQETEVQEGTASVCDNNLTFNFPLLISLYFLIFPHQGII